MRSWILKILTPDLDSLFICLWGYWHFRKLAAQISSQQRHPAVEVHTFKESEDCIIIDAEDYKTTSNSSVSMFVQHTEAKTEEIDRMVSWYDLCILIFNVRLEIEMEDAEDWSIVDIDSPDKKNSLAVVEYTDDIYAYYKKAEVEVLSPVFLFVCELVHVH